MKTATPLPRGNVYVTGPSLLSLKNDYKYTGADRSIVAANMQGFWNWAVLYIPEWMAPNMVTLLGLGFIVASYLLTYYYTPYLIGDSPRWVYLFHAFCIFMYQTLDALDGKHARRTGNSSPLGELFDHGCDAVTTTLMVLGVVSVLQLGTTWETAWIVIISNYVFFCAQWEQYTIGTLTLGEINVTEAQFVTMALYLATAILGPHFWLHTFTVAGITLKYYHPLIILNSLIVCYTIATNYINVSKAISERKLNAIKVFAQLMATTTTAVFAALWILYSPTNILQKHPHAFFVALGFLFASLVGRIVFARMCKADFSWFQPLAIPVILGFINAYTNQGIFPEVPYVYAMLALNMATYLHFAISLIDVLCALLNIQCLTPKPKPKEK